MLSAQDEPTWASFILNVVLAKVRSLIRRTPLPAPSRTSPETIRTQSARRVVREHGQPPTLALGAGSGVSETAEACSADSCIRAGYTMRSTDTERPFSRD